MKHISYIAVHGPAFSGKDTCTNILAGEAAQANTGVVIARFAAPIYRVLQALVPDATPHMLKAEKERPLDQLGGLSCRQFMIAVGEGVRKYSDHSWVHILRHQISVDVQACFDAGRTRVVVLFPDMRKLAERELFDTLGHAGTLADCSVRVTSAFVHLRPLNAPVNEQPDAATETPLPVAPGDWQMINDHKAGPEVLRYLLMGTVRDALGEGDFRDIFGGGWS